MKEKIEAASALLASCKDGFLGTLEDKMPFVSAISYIYEGAKDSGYGQIFTLLSDLARHSQNIQKNPNVSLLAIESGPSPVYEKKRVTVQGTAHLVKDKQQFEKFKARYIEAFPSSAGFFNFGDFRFYEIQIASMHLISGFGKIETLK